MSAEGRHSDPDQARRIVVACDTTPLGRAALEAGAALAAMVDSEILGLFVEDIDLFRMAELPFTREFGLESAVPRPVGPADIERAFRLQAQQTRDVLGTLCGARSLRWQFQVARGKVVRTTLELARRTDLIVFGKQVHAITARDFRPAVAGGREPSAAAMHAVATLFDGSPAAWHALEHAHALCDASRAQLVVFVPEADVEAFERLRGVARAWLAGRGRAARIVRLQDKASERISRAVRNAGAGLLLWPADAATETPDTVSALLAALGCPLVLIS